MTSSAPRLVGGTSSEFHADPVSFLLHRHAEHGDMFAVELDGVPTAVFGGQCGPALLFGAERDHLAVYNTPLVHELFGRAVFNLTGGPHREVKQRLRQAITGRSLRCLTPAITALVESHVDRWFEFGTFDVYQATREMTLDVCARLILGLPTHGHEAQKFPELFASFVAAADVDWCTRADDPGYRHGLVAAAELRAMVARQVVLLTGTSSPNMVSNLLAGGETSHMDVGDQLLAVMIAARETTASLLTWMLVELAQAPAATANAAADEIREGAGTVPPTVRSVLWGTERRHSPNVLSRRTVTAELVTPYGVIPQGWRAAYSPSVNHLLANLFDDPESFRPARFTGAQSASGLLTFGRGLHACPGKQFAELLAVTVATTVLDNYRLSLAGPPPGAVRYLPVKAPACQVKIVLERRGSHE